MKIIKIERMFGTAEESYTCITFKTWWGKEFKEICITKYDSTITCYCKNGVPIPIRLWSVVSGYLRTGHHIHEYE